MKRSEFLNLKLDDFVRLPFSGTPNHVVTNIDIKNGMIETKPIDETHVTYNNHYSSIDFVRHAIDEKIVDENVKKRDIIIKQFNEWTKDCSNCPFKSNCENTYQYTRRFSTSAINLCDALRMTEEDMQY